MDDGTRTHDDRDHNPGLYPLSSAHHCVTKIFSQTGAPGRTRTCNPRLRRPVLYPVELQALVKILTSCAQNSLTCWTAKWSGQTDSNRRPSAPKADALPDCAMPRWIPGVIRTPTRHVKCARRKTSNEIKPLRPSEAPRENPHLPQGAPYDRAGTSLRVKKLCRRCHDSL